MRRVPSSEFRVTFPRIEEPVVVTALGRAIGEWYPVGTQAESSQRGSIATVESEGPAASGLVRREGLLVPVQREAEADGAGVVALDRSVQTTPPPRPASDKLEYGGFNTRPFSPAPKKRGTK
jgi:hypothetical protein